MQLVELLCIAGQSRRFVRQLHERGLEELQTGGRGMLAILGPGEGG
jgi:hypothetical protein